MKFNNSAVDGMVRTNETYTVIDNLDLQKLVLSKVVLHTGKQTTGHSHSGVEEVYVFQHGEGKMLVGDALHDVRGGDIVTVEDGLFHRVINTGIADLVWVSVYNASDNETIYAK